MEHDFKTLNILLTSSLVLFIVPVILVAYKLVPVSEGFKTPIILAAMMFGLLYYVFLGMLASKKNRSVIKWIGLSIIFSPLGHIISFPLMLKAKPLEMEKKNI